jgi:CBS domain-containing protein
MSRREVTATEHPAIPRGRRLLAVHPATDAYGALTVMRQNEVRHLPVVADGRCVGLLTETDLLRGLACGASGAELTAGGLCHRPAPAVPSGSSLPAMAAVMTDSGADAVIVVSNGTMVGMVTGSDVLGAVTARWRDDGGLARPRPDSAARSSDLGAAH